MPEAPAHGWARGLVPAAFVVAFAFRLIGLGGSSMWLDEILETLMARGSLRELFSALLYDRAQPPVEPLLSWSLLSLGQGELVRRLENAVLGAAAVALFARWAGRRFGFPTAVLAALFLGASPVLIRYSHELRPYALSLLFSVWALDACDRWLARGARRFPLELLCAAGLAAMTHYLAVALWLPVAAAYFEARSEGRVASLGVRLPSALALSILPLAAWFALLAGYGGPQQKSRILQWDWSMVAKRFDDLLIRGYSGQPVIDGGTLLLALLTIVGCVVLARQRGGLVAFAGLFAGTVLVEGVVHAAGRFSHVRYDQFGLLFLLTAIASGIVAGARLLAAFNRKSGIATALLLSSAVLATFVTGVVGYAQHGRPDWPAVARAVEALGGAEVQVTTTMPWVQVPLGYYLGRSRDWHREPRGVATIYNDRTRLLEEIERQPGGCVLVAEAAANRKTGLLRGLFPRNPVLSVPWAGGVNLYRFSKRGIPRRDCLPPGSFRFEPSKGYGTLLPWLERQERNPG